jgi:small GTP-binding protein
MQGLVGENVGYKVVLLGDSRVGKTSIIARQLQGAQPSATNPTIGCHCSEIRVLIDDQVVTLQVWDTAGQEMYRALVPVYLRGAHAALLVYDVCDRESFVSLGHWYDTLIDVVPLTTAVYVVANKIDLEQQLIDDVQAKQFASAHNAPLFKVSAMTGEGIANLFEVMAKKVSEGAELESSARQLSEPEKSTRSCAC